ncbi:MAG TPA: ADOP family duplicated permease [Gemmatimonadaceae bacterium]
MDATTADLRFAIRSFRRAPGFAGVALVILTLGIASVTTVFSVIDAALFRPLPYPDASRIVALAEQRANGVLFYSMASPASVRELRAGVPAFDRVAAYREDFALLRQGGTTRALWITDVDTSVFPMLRVAPERGRLPSADEIREGAPVVVISDALWRTSFGGDDRVLGREIDLDGHVRTVVGIMPLGVGFPTRSLAWVPLDERRDAASDPTSPDVGVIARLRPGASKAAAAQELQIVAARLAAAYPRAFRGLRLEVRDEMIDRGTYVVRLFGSIFVAAALAVLLVACSNIANLFLVRAMERRGEMAVRAAMGASRARLVRQLFSECLVLGLVAGACATMLSAWGVRLVLSLVPTQQFPTWLRFGVDVRVLAFATFVSFVATVAFALLPAREGTRLDLTKTLKAGGGDDGRVMRHGRIGVVAQVGFALALFVVATLLWRSYHTIARLDRGTDVDHVLDVSMFYPGERVLDVAAHTERARALADRIAARPGVTSVALRGGAMGWIDSAGAAARAGASPERTDQIFDPLPYLPERGDRSPVKDAWPRLQALAVSDAYFRTLGIPIVRGRAFSDADRPGTSYGAIVSRLLAGRLWPGEDAVGRTMRIGRRGATVTVVGVARDVRQLRGGLQGSSADPLLSLYLSDRQAVSQPAVLVRTAGDPALLESDVASVARAFDRNMVVGLRTLRDEARLEALPYAAIAGILGTFALCALALAMIGTYGVIAYRVALRRREIGVRMALGGSVRDVVLLVVRQGMRYTGAGLGLGVVLALGMTQLVRFLLVGVSPLDVPSYAAVVACFVVVSLLACWLPARRAASVDPAIALRAE